MAAAKEIEQFLSPYDEQVFSHVLKLRAILLASFPVIIEQIDVPAKMIAYCYGQKYVELLCVLIPSKKGLKLGFNRGVELPDPEKLLKGTGKISRYIEIKTEQQINSKAIQQLLMEALKTYEQRIKK